MKLRVYQSGADGDRLPYYGEIDGGYDPRSNDASSDPDGDGATNYQEYRWKKNPASRDVVALHYVVTLNWNADAAYLAQLEWGISRASSMLYDATDGNLFVASVEIGDNYYRRFEADVRVLAGDSSNAANGNWPWASDPGGYWRKMGDTVSRYIIMPQTHQGNSPEYAWWWQTLTHESGHHALWGLDEYIGHTPGQGHGTWESHVSDSCVTPYDGSIMDREHVRTELDDASDTAACDSTHHWWHMGRSTWAEMVEMINAYTTMNWDYNQDGVADGAYPATHVPLQGPNEPVGLTMRTTVVNT